MNDFEMMINMFLKAKSSKPTVKWACGENLERTEKYIWLHRHRFTFDKEGNLINSETTSNLYDLSE